MTRLLAEEFFSRDQRVLKKCSYYVQVRVRTIVISFNFEWNKKKTQKLIIWKTNEILRQTYLLLGLGESTELSKSEVGALNL